MHSAGSSDIDEEIEQRSKQTALYTSRNSVSSPVDPEDQLEGPRHRKTSFVRFSKDARAASGEEVIPFPMSAPRDGQFLPVEEDDRAKGSTQSYVNSLEERVNLLETRLQSLDFSRPSDFSEKGDESSELSTLNVEPQWMTWQDYVGPANKATSILEVLFEKPHTKVRRKATATSTTAEATDKASGKAATNAIRTIERIRIRSPHIVNTLQLISKQTFSHPSWLIIHRPFKILLFYEVAIRDHLMELEAIFKEVTSCPLGKNCKGLISIEDTRYGASESPQVFPEHDTPSESGDEECKHEMSEELLIQREAIIHLRAMVAFMKYDMRQVFDRHRQLRSSNAGVIAFHDLWHLFMAGDLVVENNESNPRSPELYRVSILPVSNIFSSIRPVKKLKLRSEGAHQQVESVYREEPMSYINVDLFYFDFDGTKFGPVEKRVRIFSYEGEKNITDLPLYPIRFRDECEKVKADLVRKGMKFRELSDIGNPAHREYNGLSVIEPQEQIDSQVIVDMNLAYRLHPESVPKFGLKSWMEDDARVVTEACGVPGCTDCFKDRFMFDDHRIDRQRTVEFIKVFGSLLRTFSDSEELTEDLMMLLPNRVYGFVLRTRKWYFLDIDLVRPLRQYSEGFENLILPEGFARLVEGLVQTHSPREKPTVTGVVPQVPDHQVDLVNGKGLGLIILLHGAPGVGKTSTAECVADYTQRPLFPITCGDIGETAKEVEHNLDQNFSLAHRWGCVLLLDEADVFLQARDKEDMRRNSVVSVFLRVLEYYSGILFLTTNKVGHFDEAFKSRIHLSLYYPPLDQKSTMQIWKMNLNRLATNRTRLEFDRKSIESYAKKHYKDLTKTNRATWNGRQIKNAFQTAVALAEFDARSTDQAEPVLTTEHFNVVAMASEGFDYYMARMHGTDADRARRDGQRDDDPRDIRSRPTLFPEPSSKPSKKHERSDSSSSEDSDEKDKKKPEKGKKKGRDAWETRKNARLKESSSEEIDSSSSEDSDEKDKEKLKKWKKKKRRNAW